jgi:hypothetical protein
MSLLCTESLFELISFSCLKASNCWTFYGKRSPPAYMQPVVESNQAYICLPYLWANSSCLPNTRYLLCTYSTRVRRWEGKR